MGHTINERLKWIKLERIQSFIGEPAHVHEAPAFVPETNELEFSDTSVTGWLWAIDIDTHTVCNRLSVTFASLPVIRSGYLLIAALGGVDIIIPKTVILLGKINAPGDIIFNLERGPSSMSHSVWLLTRQNYIYKLTIREA